MSEIKDRVKALRTSRGVSQTVLGEAIGLTFSGVSAIEKGQSENPEKLRAIADYFNVDRNWLITGEGPLPDGVILKPRGDQSAPWRDEAYETLKKENQRLWMLIEKLTQSPIGSFLEPTRSKAQLRIPFTVSVNEVGNAA